MLKEAQEVCPTTTRRMLANGALMVDVREAAEVRSLAFDVPDVVNIPLSEFEQRWSELPTEREIIVVCQVGERSLKATYHLQYRGYERVSNMGGGIVKWMRKGFPVNGRKPDAVASNSGCCGNCVGAEESANHVACACVGAITKPGCC